MTAVPLCLHFGHCSFIQCSELRCIPRWGSSSTRRSFTSWSTRSSMKISIENKSLAATARAWRRLSCYLLHKFDLESVVRVKCNCSQKCRPYSFDCPSFHSLVWHIAWKWFVHLSNLRSLTRTLWGLVLVGLPPDPLQRRRLLPVQLLVLPYVAAKRLLLPHSIFSGTTTIRLLIFHSNSLSSRPFC